MALLRHSDMKLTSKVYTDERQLPIYDTVKVLPRLAEHTQIRAQISGAEGQNLSQDDASNGKGSEPLEADNDSLRRDMTVPVASVEMAVRGGFEPPVAFWTTAL